MKPRPYQSEALEAALNGNIILCLPTGSGKTFVAILLLKQIGHQLEPDYDEGGQRAFFLVPTRVLVRQQAQAIQESTDFRVGKFSGEDMIHRSHDYWIEQLKIYQVLVMTRRIYLNMLRKGVIANQSIAAVIFDEAHKAAPNRFGQLTGDDYVKIMETLKTNGIDGIKILCLSASLINYGANNTLTMPSMIEKLQNVYSAKIFFPEKYGFVEGTNPDEILWIYRKQNPPYDAWTHHLQKTFLEFRKIRNKYQEVEDTIKENNMMSGNRRTASIPVSLKEMEKTFDELKRIYHEMGPWALFTSLNYTLDNYQRVLNLLESQAGLHSRLVKLVVRFLENLSKKMFGFATNCPPNVQPFVRIPDKLARLIQLLYNFKDQDSRLSAIIFVDRRLDAFALSSWLNLVSQIDDNLSFIRTDYTLGANGVSTFPYNIFNQGREVQEEIIQDFRDHKLNILVATSVLEEGFDIPQCNLIIRYDKVKSYQSYVQSKGRARKKGAHFVFFAPHDEKWKFNRIIERFRYIEKKLVSLAKRAAEQKRSQNSKIDPIDCLKSPTHVQLSLQQAREKVHLYCDSLPSDAFTDKMPVLKVESLGGVTSPSKTRYNCTLHLPKISPLQRLPLESKKCSSEESAKLHAYFEAIIQLWAHQELDDSFSSQSIEVIMEQIIQISDLNIDLKELKEYQEKCRRAGAMDFLLESDDEIGGSHDLEKRTVTPDFAMKRKRFLLASALKQRLCLEIGYGDPDIPPYLDFTEPPERFTILELPSARLKYKVPKEQLDFTDIIICDLSSEEGRRRTPKLEALRRGIPADAHGDLPGVLEADRTIARENNERTNGHLSPEQSSETASDIGHTSQEDNGQSPYKPRHTRRRNRSKKTRKSKPVAAQPIPPTNSVKHKIEDPKSRLKTESFIPFDVGINIPIPRDFVNEQANNEPSLVEAGMPSPKLPERTKLKIFSPEKYSLFDNDRNLPALKPVDWKDENTDETSDNWDQIQQDLANHRLNQSKSSIDSYPLKPKTSIPKESSPQQELTPAIDSSIPKTIYVDKEKFSESGLPLDLICQALTTERCDAECNLK